MHGLFKAFVPHTNKKNIDLDLLRHSNTLQALRFWLDGGRDERVPNSGWYITESNNLLHSTRHGNCILNYSCRQSYYDYCIMIINYR